MSDTGQAGGREVFKRWWASAVVALLRRPIVSVVTLLAVLAVAAVGVRSVVTDASSAEQRRDVAAHTGWTQIDPFRWPSLPMEGVEALNGAEATGPPSAGVVVVNLWASWCTQCRDEMPLLQEVAQQGSVAVFGVSTDTQVDVAAEALGARNVTFPNLVDTQARLREAIGTRIPIVGLPASLLLVDGEIRAIHVGVFDTAADIEAGIRDYASG